MSDTTRNILIGKGEKLISDGIWKGSSSKKPLPYTIEQQRTLLHPSLILLSKFAATATLPIAPRSEICAKITLHPEYLAKSYFPAVLLRQSNLRLLGSRGVVVTPRAMVRGKAPYPGQTASLIVAGTKASFDAADAMLMVPDQSNLLRHEEFCQLERIELFNTADRLRVDLLAFNGWLEVSLHASLGDNDIQTAFTKLVHSSGGRINAARMRTVGGLTFVPIEVDVGNPAEVIALLSEFSHLRLIRNMPQFTCDPEVPSSITRQLLFPAPPLPTGSAVNPNIRVAIFDGGFPSKVLPWVTAKDAAKVPAVNPGDLAHGTHVTSAYLFGAVDDQAKTLARPYTNVDHIRVLPSRSQDLRVLDVIDRIIDTLKAARDDGHPYELANLSLGPRIPILDEDPHEWTVRLDDLLSLGDLFMTVAIGNDGREGPDLGRIQPPSDAVNCFAVGASDRPDGKWQRAEYSGIGPGRSPGLVKPDAMAHGGSTISPLQLYSPVSKNLVHRLGTSYSAPLALRLAGGLRATVTEPLTPIMLHALLVSSARMSRRQHEQTAVGWGLLPATLDEVLYSAPDEVVVMYQGAIEAGQPLRARVPLPPGLAPDAEVRLRATFAYRAPTDPAHPINYTQAGLLIRFQPDSNKSESFFGLSMYDNEEVLRRDALRWDTCLSRERKLRAGDLTAPSFVINYQTREEGHAKKKVKSRAGTAKDIGFKEKLPFALVLRMKIPGVVDLAPRVLLQYDALQEVSLRASLDVPPLENG